MNARGPPPPPPPPGAMPGQQQQQPPPRQFVPPPFHSNTRFADITPPVTLTEEFVRRHLTSYEVQTIRKVDPIITQDFPDKKRDENSRKQKKRSKSPPRPKSTWLRVAISVERYEQDAILKKVKALDRKRQITDKKATLAPHMNSHVDKILDEKNHYEYDSAFIWSLCQLDRVTVTNKKTKKRETETLTLYLKRSPRPEVNIMTVYHNIERAKLQPPPQPVQNQQGPHPNGQFPPQQRAPSQGPQQRAPSQGPPQRGPAQGPPRQQPNNPPGRSGPAPVQVVHDGGKNNGKFSGKGGDDEIIHVVDEGGPNRKAGRKKIYSKRKSTPYHSDDSSSSASSASGSDSESGSGSAYSESESDPSSISLVSLNRRRRESGYARGKGRGTRQHEKGYFMVNRPRRHSSATYVPDPPRLRAHSFERLSHNPIELEDRISEAKAEAFAAGFQTAKRVSVVDRASISPQRTITYRDDLSQRSSLQSLDEDIRALGDSRAEALRLENLRLKEDLRRQEDIRIREDLRLREEANSRLRNDVRRFSDIPTREEIRLRTDLRRAQDAIRHDELPSPRLSDPDHFRRGSLSSLAFDPLPPSPRARDFGYPRRESLSTLPLEPDMPFQYVRNPFQRRRDPQYID